MKSTSFGSNEVKMPARSPGLSSTGPEVTLKPTPSSLAMMLLSVVFPSPGGPWSRVWSRGSPRYLAASTNTFRFSTTLLLPAEVAELQGAQGVLELALGRRRLRAVYVKIFFHRGKDTIFSAQNGHARHFLCGLPQEMPHDAGGVSAAMCPASRRPKGHGFAQCGAAACGIQNRTLRRVLEYFAESTLRHCAPRVPFSTAGTAGDGNAAETVRSHSVQAMP